MKRGGFYMENGILMVGRLVLTIIVAVLGVATLLGLGEFVQKIWGK